MNTISFDNPNGFPLEADATLGFMQTDYQEAIRGLAGVVGVDLVIVSGMVDTGSNVSDGWCLIDGDLVKFQGGPKTVNIVVNETVVEKANQDGTMYDRYYSKRAQFGSGTVVYPYANFKRVENLVSVRSKMVAMLGEDGVILTGCTASSVNVGASTMNVSAGVVEIYNAFFDVPAYSGAYPAYINQTGQWVTSVPAGPYIKFDPYTSQRLRSVMKRNASETGEIRMIAALSDRFDNTGLGKWEWLGWAICNGANGTVDMRSRFPVGYDNRTSDPGGNLWDNAYQTPGAAGGEKAHTLSIGEMPSHTHTGGSGAVPSGQYGLVRRSFSGASSTVTATDSSGSGNEPDVLQPPQHIPAEGGGLPHENRPPFRVVVYIQKL